MDDLKTYPFVGWIPCLCGHLFFDLTQCGLYDSRVFANVNHEERGAGDAFRRSLLIASDVNWKDRPDTPNNDKPRLRGKFNVLLLAQHLSGDDHLSGDIHIVPADLAEQAIWIDIFQQTAVIESQADQGDDIATDIKRLDQRIGKTRTDRVWSVHFQLTTSGFVGLRLDRHGEQQPSSIEAEVLSRQAYYYIKYCFHIHQHHHDSVDSLTTIHRTKSLAGTATEAGGSELGKRLIVDLKRSLVDLKRNAEEMDYRSLVQTSGVIAYAKSLVVACHAQGILDSDTQAQELHYLDNLDASVQNKVRAINEGHGLAQEYAARFQSVVLLLLALIAPVTLIYRDQISGGSGDMPLVAKLISDLLHGQWTVLILLILAVSYAIWRLNATPRKIFAPLPWHRRLRNALRDTVCSRYKGDVLWWILTLFGALGVSGAVWWAITT